MRTWVNGSLLDRDDAVVSAFDHGLTVGDGAFETVKVVDGVPFALRRHLDRLARSAAGLGLPDVDRDQARAACEAVCGQAPVGLYRLRITYTGGIAPLGSERGDAGPTLVVAIAPTAPPAETTSVAVVDWPRNERGALAGLKTTSYAENVVALATAKGHGATEAVFADTQGRLSEGTGSNVFMVVGGELLTPALSTGCLNGITRQLLIEWAGAREVELQISVLDESEELFLTSSVRDVQSVGAIVGARHARNLPVAPGPVTREVAALFAKHSAEDPEP